MSDWLFEHFTVLMIGIIVVIVSVVLLSEIAMDKRLRSGGCHTTGNYRPATIINGVIGYNTEYRCEDGEVIWR